MNDVNEVIELLTDIRNEHGNLPLVIKVSGSEGSAVETVTLDNYKLLDGGSFKQISITPCCFRGELIKLAKELEDEG